MSSSSGEWPIIGIDLGTTNSCVAIWRAENDRAEIIVNESGTYTTPSMVAFTEHERLIGVAAKNQAAMNPRNTVYDSKRLIGRKYSDIQNDTEFWPFKVVAGAEDRPLYEVEFMGKTNYFTAEQISAMVLSHMKKMAEDYLGCSVKNAVVTVPAYFNDSQRCATVDAAQIAGLNVVRIINEPTAAALAYGLDKINSADGKKNVIVFDLGGGTLDVTLLEIRQGVIEVKTKSGDTQLGGQDFDHCLVKHFAEEFKKKHNLEISNTSSPRAFLRLKTKCEEVKRLLSSTVEQKVFMDALCEHTDLNTKISRVKFEDLNKDLFRRCIDVVESCLIDTNIYKSKIDEVVLVGGSSRIPKIQTLLKEFFKVNAFSKTINPDEAVAYGAAVQAAILGGVQSRSVQGIVLEDVTPLSLGVENVKGTMRVVVPKNTKIPITKKDLGETTEDNQEKIGIYIYEGERPIVEQNNPLGEFHICDLPRAPKGEVKIDVTFDIDSNSILTVTAMERKTGKTEKITINYASGRLTKEEIDRMILEAEKYKAQDELRKQVAMAKHELDEYAYNILHLIEDQLISCKLDAEIKKRIQREVRDAIEWAEKNENRAGAGDYRRKKGSLETSWNVVKTAVQMAGMAIGLGLS